MNVIKPLPSTFVPSFALQFQPTMAQFDLSSAPTLTAPSAEETAPAPDAVRRVADSPVKERSHAALMQDLFDQIANVRGDGVI
ncbi:hypothetical protein FHW58_000591 [Duganella sp. 1224]|uniref:hypothetical protein n=1 Tax=Duganella sp. 1224 TaxID=2587052 RepID=UPI0015C87AAC|nr:hypothetical protein [Duganella sp. 1224]NYE59439.1 hypothetical protein [Duganella sp. 1224]